MHTENQHDDQLIELGVATEEIKGVEGPILDVLQTQRQIQGITAE